jgi:GR25 family glycosyltransferase involved in LPS biosynthesis
MSNVGKYLPDFNLEVIESVDGETLNPFEERDKISSWNFRHLSEKKLRAVIGCCKSHLRAYENFLDANFSHALIFEDDAHPNVPQETLQSEINSVELPKNFGIIYLNSFKKEQNNPTTQELIKLNKRGETAESYIISKEFAEIAYGEISNTMGALDRHLELLFNHPKAKNLNFYRTKRQIFYQYDRNDTDIQKF